MLVTVDAVLLFLFSFWFIFLISLVSFISF